MQFAPVQGYQQIHAGKVWELFKSDFPTVQEHPALPSTFETFGFAPPQFGFDFLNGATHDRFWFLTDSQEELIQFQMDKFLHNWRKVRDEKNEYPRFEKIITKFSKELKTLETFFQKTFVSAPLSINQCEITYVNFIYQEDVKNLALSEIFSFLKFNGDPSEISCSFNSYITNSKGEPKGRIKCELNQALGIRGPLYRLSLTVRGAPETTTLNDALNFIISGRETIVNLFKETTSSKAHDLWRIKK